MESPTGRLENVMLDRLKLPLSFNPSRMREDLSLLERIDWVDHFVNENYEGS